MGITVLILLVNTLFTIFNSDFNIIGALFYLCSFFVGFYCSFYSSSVFYFLGDVPEFGYLILFAILFVHMYFGIKCLTKKYKDRLSILSNEISKFR
jgi:hypothetical protein